MTTTTEAEDARKRREAALLALKADRKIDSGQAQDALGAAAGAVAIMPREPRFLITMGRALTVTGNHEDARVQYDQAVEYADLRHDDDLMVDSRKARAWGADVAGNLQAAREDLGAMIDLRDTWNTRARRAITAARLKDYVSAIADLNTAVELRGEPDASIQAMLGQAHRAEAFRLREKENDRTEAQVHAQKALHHLEMAVEIEPMHGPANFALHLMMGCRAHFGLEEF